MALFAMLAEFGLQSLGEGAIRLVGNNHLRDRLQTERGVVEGLLHQHLGAPFRLDVSEGSPSLEEAPSLRLLEHQRQAALAAEVSREAQANPRVQALLAHFGGTLRHVRPLVEPRSRQE